MDTEGSGSSALEEVMETLRKNQDDAVAAMKEAQNLAALQELRVKYLGKKGSVTSVLKSIGKLPKADRPKLGGLVNQVKDEIQALFDKRKVEIEDEEIERMMVDEHFDVTLPGVGRKKGSVHPIRATIQKAVDCFVELGYELVDGPELSPEIETDYFCFEALNCPEDHPARDMQDTLYITDDQKYLLRSQTSAVQARYMKEFGPPFAIVCPGRVYRRDDIDATHSFQFHQIEIMALGKDLTLEHLRGTVIHFLKRMFGDEIKVRFRASFFPFTEPSMEVDVFFNEKWLEVLGCGMVDPFVIEKAGYDPEEWQGFAAGFGVERFSMVINEIRDIREFTNNNQEFLEQFNFHTLDGA